MRAAALALLVGCARPGPTTPAIDKHGEILSLWSQIREWRREAHLDLDPSTQTLLQVRRSTAPAEKKRMCPDHHEVPKSCGDVCNLGDAICDNAEQICAIADELGKDDDFAQTKCESAKASCREAKQRCCDCHPPEETP